MGDEVGENPAALRAAVFLLSPKNRRGWVFKHPLSPSRAKVNRIYATKKYLFNIGIREHDACTFCEESTETIFHLFLAVPRNTNIYLPSPCWGVFEHPLRFFADSKKTAARSAARFSPTLSPIFLATFVRVSILGYVRSGHQVRSSDHTLQKHYNRAPATVFEEKL